jgi:pimeloyl-ACP methyl ester carboxylesterase
VAPDQRGFAGSSKPARVEDYAVERIVADLIALADALGIGRFTLIGHDWGGAAAWTAALTRPDRVARLAILNAPHPLIFQKSLIEDEGQRAASQYIRAFREPGTAERIEADPEALYDRLFAPLVPAGVLTAEDRAAYLAEWRRPGALPAMLNWYKATGLVVPAIGEAAPPPAWVEAPFPVLEMPVLVLWGIRDKALLPVQLDGLDALCRDLTVERVEAGHFLTWETPAPVTAAIRRWLEAKPA